VLVNLHWRPAKKIASPLSGGSPIGQSASGLLILILILSRSLPLRLALRHLLREVLV
jgi:hypothetical protein